ncbi:hypothetical protein JCM21900_003755 [Sporobolomyces salmonicolor]
MFSLRTRICTVTATASAPLTRLASTQAPRLPKKAPFAAPPVDETRGALGQVYLPDMAALERQHVVEVKIPSTPDNYTSLGDTPSFPLLRPGAIETVAPPETHLGGGPSSSAHAAK